MKLFLVVMFTRGLKQYVDNAVAETLSDGLEVLESTKTDQELIQPKNYLSNCDTEGLKQ